MSQYTSRIHIRVAEPEVWNKFRDTDDADFGLADLADRGSLSFSLDDWFCDEDELRGIVTALAKTLGEDGVIIADTTNINVDPYAYIVYSAGCGVHSKNHRNSEYCFETNISDLAECCSYKNYFAFDAQELKVLKRAGMERVREGRKFVFKLLEQQAGLDLEDEFFLTDTRFEGRTQRIENVKQGDPVRLVHEKSDKSYPNMVEVFSDEGSLGLLEETAADIMAPLMDEGKKEYEVTVRNVIPLSKRSARCRGAIISVHIRIKAEPPKNDNTAPAKVIGGSGDDAVFSYRRIDDMGTGFYDGVCDGKGLIIPEDKTTSVSVDGKTVNIMIQTQKKMKTINRQFKSALLGRDTPEPFYDPLTAMDGNLEITGQGEYNQNLYRVSDAVGELETAQIGHRVKLFAKVVEQLDREDALAKIVEAAPKKKNGTLYTNRVTQVATLFCMARDASMYVLCAVAKDDSTLLLEIRKIVTANMDKAEADVISTSNLFRAK